MVLHHRVKAIPHATIRKKQFAISDFFSISTLVDLGNVCPPVASKRCTLETNSGNQPVPRGSLYSAGRDELSIGRQKKTYRSIEGQKKTYRISKGKRRPFYERQRNALAVSDLEAWSDVEDIT